MKLAVIYRETVCVSHTFYPLACCQPNPACALRSGDLNENKPHLLVSVALQPGWVPGLFTSCLPAVFKPVLPVLLVLPMRP